MKIYNPKKNVFDAALERINYLFDEFDTVVACTSGGKDSTIILELCLMVARQRDRLPLKVLFLDQEAEYTKTIEYMRRVMYRPEVEPLWFQMPFKIFNATSKYQEWLQCWGDGQEWMRPKEPIAITENKYGTDRFAELFNAIANKHFDKNKKVCLVGGLRAEEAPKRFVSLTHAVTYKWITWGKKLGSKNTKRFTFYPIYDWLYKDVYSAIVKNNWDYNRVYDDLYAIGKNFTEMRVSNLNHETAVQSLYQLQEIDPVVYNAITKRIQGADTVAKFGYDDFFVNQHELPFMFKSWKDYRDYLLEYLVINPEFKEKMRLRFAWHDLIFGFRPNKIGDKYIKVHISTIIANDVYLSKIDNLQTSPDFFPYIRELRKNGDMDILRKMFKEQNKIDIDDESGKHEDGLN